MKNVYNYNLTMRRCTCMLRDDAITITTATTLLVHPTSCVPVYHMYICMYYCITVPGTCSRYNMFFIHYSHFHLSLPIIITSNTSSFIRSFCILLSTKWFLFFTPFRFWWFTSIVTFPYHFCNCFWRF